MKKNLLKITTMSTVFAFGLGLISNVNVNSTTVYATQHSENYSTYTYSGNYYNGLSAYDSPATEGLNGTLRKRLSSLILPKAWFTYSGSNDGQLGKILQSADEDPTNSENMVLFYSRDSITKRSAGGTTSDWNREHVWPQSLSNSHWGKTEAGTDILHIRPTWSTTNSKRGSTVYGKVGNTGAQYYDGMLYAHTSGSRFEPIDSVKGDVARILMYVWTAYTDYYNDSKLVITKAIESYDTLLEWHTMDKPDALEGLRNNFSESSKQKNRNPFVDHPEYAWKIFGDSASANIKNSCKAAYPDSSQGTTSSSNPSSNISSEAPSSSSSLQISSTIVTSSENSSVVISSECSSASSEEPFYENSSESSSIENSSNEELSSSAISSEQSTEVISSDASSSEEQSSIQSEQPSSSSVSSQTPSSKQQTVPSISSEKSSENATSFVESNKPQSSSEDDEIVVTVKGCKGSIVGTVSLLSIASVCGLIFVFSKKKK